MGLALSRKYIETFDCSLCKFFANIQVLRKADLDNIHVLQWVQFINQKRNFTEGRDLNLKQGSFYKLYNPSEDVYVVFVGPCTRFELETSGYRDLVLQYPNSYLFDVFKLYKSTKHNGKIVDTVIVSHQVLNFVNKYVIRNFIVRRDPPFLGKVILPELIEKLWKPSLDDSKVAGREFRTFLTKEILGEVFDPLTSEELKEIENEFPEDLKKINEYLKYSQFGSKLSKKKLKGVKSKLTSRTSRTQRTPKKSRTTRKSRTKRKIKKKS